MESAWFGLGPVTLQVADLQRSVAFYIEVVGLRLLERGERGARLGGPEGSLLVQLVELPGASPVPPRGRVGLFHFAILLPDRTALGRFLRHLVERGIRVGTADHGVSEALYLTDPDGLGIEVYRDRPIEAWHRGGDEVHMVTEPLDVRALVGAAGDEPWEGVPPGTTMGHIHLQVDDLARAEEFYASALGLDVTLRDYPGALFLSSGGYHHHLGLNTWGSGAPQREGDARLLEWRILLGDERSVEGSARRLEARGHTVRREATSWTVRDPWGTVLRVAERTEGIVPP